MCILENGIALSPMKIVFALLMIVIISVSLIVPSMAYHSLNYSQDYINNTFSIPRGANKEYVFEPTYGEFQQAVAKAYFASYTEISTYSYIVWTYQALSVWVKDEGNRTMLMPVAYVSNQPFRIWWSKTSSQTANYYAVTHLSETITGQTTYKYTLNLMLKEMTRQQIQEELYLTDNTYMQIVKTESMTSAAGDITINSPYLDRWYYSPQYQEANADGDANWPTLTEFKALPTVIYAIQGEMLYNLSNTPFNLRTDGNTSYVLPSNFPTWADSTANCTEAINSMVAKIGDVYVPIDWQSMGSVSADLTTFSYNLPNQVFTIRINGQIVRNLPHGGESSIDLFQYKRPGENIVELYGNGEPEPLATWDYLIDENTDTFIAALDDKGVVMWSDWDTPPFTPDYEYRLHCYVNGVRRFATYNSKGAYDLSGYLKVGDNVITFKQAKFAKFGYSVPVPVLVQETTLGNINYTYNGTGTGMTNPVEIDTGAGMTPTTGTMEAAPDRSDYADGMGGDIQYGFSTVLYWMQYPFKLIGLLIHDIINGFSEAFSWAGAFAVSLGNLLSFLPSKLSALMISAISLVIIISLIKFARG